MVWYPIDPRISKGLLSKCESIFGIGSKCGIINLSYVNCIIRGLILSTIRVGYCGYWTSSSKFKQGNSLH